MTAFIDIIVCDWTTFFLSNAYCVWPWNATLTECTNFLIQYQEQENYWVRYILTNIELSIYCWQQIVNRSWYKFQKCVHELKFIFILMFKTHYSFMRDFTNGRCRLAENMTKGNFFIHLSSRLKKSKDFNFLNHISFQTE